MTRTLTIIFAIVAPLAWQSGRAQSPAVPPPPDIPALVRQLGDPKVRLRDEAEARLRTVPSAAAAALEEAARNHPSEEGRVRAKKIIDSLTRNRWHLAADLGHGHLPGFTRPPLLICVSNDLTRFLTQGQDHACLWDTASLNPVHRFGQSNGNLAGWEGAATVSAITLSPDGKTAITPDDFGNLHETDAATGELRHSWFNFDQEFDASAPSNMKVVWSVSFTPDGKHLVTGGRNGYIVVREAATRNRVASLQISEHTHRNQFYSPDARWLLIIEDTPSDVDYINVIDTTTWRESGRRAIRDLINSLTFFKDGTRFIASGRNGHIATWEFDPATGAIGTEQAWGSYGTNVSGIILSPDQKSLMVASPAAGKALCEYDLETRKILWSDTNTAKVAAIAPLGPDRFITSDWDYHLRVWRKTPPTAANPPPPLVRTLADTLDPAEAYTLRYEADPHQARPCLVDAMIYLPTSELLVTRGHDKIQISSATDLSTVRSFGPQSRRMTGNLSRATCGAIAVTKDEQTVIAADDQGVIGFYEIETGKLIRSFPTVADDAATAFSPDDLATWEIVPDHEEKILYTTDNRLRLCAWDMATGNLIAVTRLPAPGATMQLSPDGSLLVIRTHDAQAFSNQVLVATAGLKMVDLGDGARDASHGLGSFSDDGSAFLRPEPDGQLRRFTLAKQRLGPPEVVLRLPATLYQTSFSDDGTRMICAAAGAVPLSVWDLPARKLLWMVDGSRGGLYRAIPLGTDRIVTLGLSDNKIRLYKRNNATP